MFENLVAKIGQFLIEGIGAFVLLVVVLRAYNTFFRSSKKRLATFVANLSFSARQLGAMRSLLHWYKTSKTPQADPLENLDTAEVADLLDKTDLAKIPPGIRRRIDEKATKKLGSDLIRRGMNPVQAQIVVGMVTLKLGPAKDLNEQ